MRRIFLLTPVLVAVLAFSSMPARADIYADVNIHSGHRGQVYDARGAQGDWQDGRAYDRSGGAWDNGACDRDGAWQRHGGRHHGERMYGYGGGQFRGGQYGGGWQRNQGGDRQWNSGDRQGRDQRHGGDREDRRGRDDNDRNDN